jgi:serine/threonine-protein kinase
MLGRVLDDRFLLKSVLGTGGMGTVYRAEQFSMNRDVAVKILKAEASRDDQAVRRFLTEARAASRLNSPHTVTVHDFGRTSDGILYIAMELMDGRTLAQVLKDEGKPFGLVRTTRLLNQVLDSMEEAHGVGILHRDLKPDNVFLLEAVGSRDFVKVLDFGVAKMVGESKPGSTQSGLSLGTPVYMSPEQMMGQEVGPATDLYALGIMMFELLAGSPPLEGLKHVEMAMRKIEGRMPSLHDLNPNAETVPELDVFLARVLASKPSDRPFDVETFRDELNRAVRNATTGPRPPPLVRSMPITRTLMGIPAFTDAEVSAGSVDLDAATMPGETSMPPPISEADGDTGSPTDQQPASKLPTRAGVPWAIAAAQAADRATNASRPAAIKKKITHVPAASPPKHELSDLEMMALHHDGTSATHAPGHGLKFLKTSLGIPMADILAAEDASQRKQTPTAKSGIKSHGAELPIGSQSEPVPAPTAPLAVEPEFIPAQTAPVNDQIDVLSLQELPPGAPDDPAPLIWERLRTQAESIDGFVDDLRASTQHPTVVIETLPPKHKPAVPVVDPLVRPVAPIPSLPVEFSSQSPSATEAPAEPKPRPVMPHRSRPSRIAGDRRAFPRKAHLISVTCVKDGVRHPAFIADLSESGAFLNSAWLPSHGEEIVVLFRPRTEDSGPAIVLLGMVVRTVEVPSGPGQVRGFSMSWRALRTQGRLGRLLEFHRHIFGLDLPTALSADVESRVWEYRFEDHLLIGDHSTPNDE